MYISSFRLRDYKSYLDSNELSLLPGINLVVGQNDVGKSALLEGLGLRFSNKPHRSPDRSLTANKQKDLKSNVEISFTISNDELMDILRNFPGEFLIPLPAKHELFEKYSPNLPEYQKLMHKYTLHDGSNIIDCARIYILSILNSPELTFRVNYYKKDDNSIITHVPMEMYGWQHGEFPALRNFLTGGTLDKRLYASCHLGDEDIIVIDNEDKFLDGLNNNNGLSNLVREPKLEENREDNLDFGLSIAKLLQERIYLFRALRTAQKQNRLEYNSVLEPDASNLASYLVHIQQKTPKIFRDINHNLTTILPQIFEIGTRNIPADYASTIHGNSWDHEIIVYQNEGSDEQYAIPLADCGTGVGQVLAILSVIISSKYPRSIIIDEPQSFLHPGAVHKLLDIFKRFPQHQYIISTHSPLLITASQTETITLVTKEPGRPSCLKKISPFEQDHLTICLEELGARLSDVFGADRMLWVEGKTEAKCFPLIIKKLLKRPLLGTAIVQVDSTGDLEGKDADRVIKIYERLSEAQGLIPRTLGFIFDRENRTPEKIADLERRLGGNRVRFPKRMMIENYFLNPKAIAEIVNKLDGFSDMPIKTQSIKKWLTQILTRAGLPSEQEKRYYPKIQETAVKNKNRKPLSARDIMKRNLDTIHGGHVLEDLFSEFSGNRTQYEKVVHGLLLTDWLIDHSPKDLKELKDLLSAFVNSY